jgi:2-polyprenyl-3-methyl-5-hydroxy-6-metoxy-1,4-benzoquinol methylase
MASQPQKTETSYYTGSRDDIMHLVPASARTVLDVGCGAGEFGRQVQKALNAEVWGVELHADIAAMARNSLYKVLEGDAAEVLPTLPEGYFDLITFNDVLEHMVDPEYVLRLAGPLLSSGGSVFVSLPNLRHWDEFRRLLWLGEFEYAERGVLDSTHLRFFTQKSIPGFFARAGYRITHTEGIGPTPSRSLKLLNLATLNRFQDCRFLQFAVLVRPLDHL